MPIVDALDGLAIVCLRPPTTCSLLLFTIISKKLGGKVFAIHPGHVATYMRGHLDTTAKITPDVSAEGILHVVLDMPHPINSRPLYLDYTGKELPW